MTLARLQDAWDEFFFTPQSVLPISLFRILYGICVTSTLLLLRGDWLEWFGSSSWITLDTMQALEPGTRLNLFTVVPQDDFWIKAFFWFAVTSSLSLTVGFFTRWSSVLTFICLASIQQRNLLITHGGDTFLRVTGFFLIFAPAGAAYSIDALRAKSALKHISPPRSLAAPWAQRMIQGELTCLYLMSFWWKMKGHAWLDGSALYYVLHLQDLSRFPVPEFLLSPISIRIGSWMTLVIEFALSFAIWLPRTKYPALLLGICFHLALEYSLNIPMFQWDVLAAYILFVEPHDLDLLAGRLEYRFRSSR